MNKMERLRAEARETATLRGHLLGRFKASVITPEGGKGEERPGAVAVCEICSAFVVVDPNPPPGEPEILGLAVDDDCHPIEGETHESA
jgi:hypothetical protein